MKRPVLDSCCFRGSLRFGTIATGVLGVILSLITLIFIFSTKVKMKMFILQDLDPIIGKLGRSVERWFWQLCSRAIYSWLVIRNILTQRSGHFIIFFL